MDWKKERRFCSRIGFALLLAVLVPIIWQGLLYAAAYALTRAGVPLGETANAVYQLMLLVGSYLVTLPLLWLLLRRVPFAPPEKRPVRVRDVARWFWIGYALLYAGAWLGSAINTLAYSLSGRAPADLLNDAIGVMPLSVVVLGACVLGPICEEVLFRFFIGGRLSRYGQAPAAVVSALLFALFHANLSQFFYAFALGILLAYAYFRTGRLWVSCLLHMLLNFCGSALSMLLMDNEVLLTIYALLLLALTIGGIVLLIVYAVSGKWGEWAHGVCEPRMKTIFGNVGMIAGIIACFAELAIIFVWS